MKRSVLYLIHTSGQGGAEDVIASLARGLDPDRFEAAIAVPGDGWLPQRLRAMGVEVYDYEGPGRARDLSWSRVQQLTRLIRSRNADVVQCHSYPLSLYAIAAARRAGSRCVVSVRGTWDTFAKPHRTLAHGLIGRLADVVTTPSADLAEQLQRRARVPASRLEVIPNGVDAERFRPQDPAAARAEMGLPRHAFVMATLGHLRPVKGHADLLDALGRVKDRIGDWRLLIAGEGPLRLALETRAHDLGLGDRVHLLGYRSDPEAVLAACDVFVLPSLAEGMSNALLQALACGRPVVATQVGGNPEVVTADTGLLAPPRAPEQLAEALLTLASDPELRARMGEAGRARAVQEYSLSRMIHRYEDLYEQWPQRAPARARPLRVVISGPTSAGRPGGQAVQAAQLVAGLREREVEVRFVPQNPPLPRPLRLRVVRAAVRSLLHLARLARHLAWADVVHIFAASGSSFFLFPAPALAAARLAGKSSVLNYRCGFARAFLTSWGRGAKPVIGLADRLVVPSGYLRDVFAELGLRASVIPNAVDPGLFRFAARGRLKPALLCSRGLQPLCDTPTLLRAFARIQERYPAATLSVAGSGSEEKACQRLCAELGLQGVEFVGAVSRREIAALYQGADIFVNSSVVDNMPNSVLEAFACGLPVVTTRAGGIPYIVQHERNGLLAACGDDAGLAEAVIRLLDDGDLAARMAGTARADVDALYNPEAAEESWIRTYRGECLPEWVGPDEREGG